MTSRERLLTAMRRGTPDRVPVTIYELSPFGDDWAHHEPSYRPLLELERRYGDGFLFAPVDCPVFLGDPNAVHGTEVRHEDGTVVDTTRIETAKGSLQAISRRDPGMMTNWQIEPLIKTDADIERLLSMPDPPAEVDVARIRQLEAELGDRGLLCFSVGDAIGHVVGLFNFEDFVRRCHKDDGPVRALLDKAQAQVLRAVERIGAVVTDAAFRLWGPEYCGAPLMNPNRYFPGYVVERDRVVTEAIHATGNLSVIHCHGNLNHILEMIADIGADALEPLETLPVKTADVTLGDIKRRIGNRMCLMGAIQALTLETGAVEEVRDEVRAAIETAAPGGGFVLLPTSAPFSVPLDAKLLKNLEAMYLAAHEFGAYK